MKNYLKTIKFLAKGFLSSSASSTSHSPPPKPKLILNTASRLTFNFS